MCYLPWELCMIFCILTAGMLRLSHQASEILEIGAGINYLHIRKLLSCSPAALLVPHALS